MLKFVLLVNKQGQTRLSQYYSYVPVEERVVTEADIVRKCLSRSEDAVSCGVKPVASHQDTLNLTCSALSWSTRTSKWCIGNMLRSISSLG